MQYYCLLNDEKYVMYSAQKIKRNRKVCGLEPTLNMMQLEIKESNAVMPHYTQ